MSGPARGTLRCGDRALVLGARTYVMGIVNVTPDSFSDGGAHYAVRDAVDHAVALVDAGADIVDLGGESTRPGAALIGEGAVSVDEERRRVLPVIEALVQRGITNLSIDTRHAKVANDAVDRGIAWVNDVSAGDDDGMGEVMRRAQAAVLMHWQKSKDFDAREDKAAYIDVVSEVHAFLLGRVQRLGATAGAGGGGAIIVDPGLGFGKSVDDNLKLLKSGARFHDLGAVLIGASRKRFLGALTGRTEAKDRDDASVGAACMAASMGADIVRVHAVRQTIDALKIVDATVRC